MTRLADADRIAAYYDTQAERYDAVMAGDPENARVRSAFHDLVAATVPARARLLDFGCGTGVDARWYASRGYSVVAYDPARRMIARTASLCAHEIMDGRIVPVSFPFTEFPHALPPHAGFDVVTANFAVLNLLGDVRGVFDAMGRVLVAGGVVLANVLNPFHWRGLHHLWWWRSLATSVGTGTLSDRRPETSTHRHLISTIVHAAAPTLTLGERRAVSGRFGQFIFLVLRRTP
jgi:SAM-dependent methyltransferase